MIDFASFNLSNNTKKGYYSRHFYLFEKTGRWPSTERVDSVYFSYDQKGLRLNLENYTQQAN